MQPAEVGRNYSQQFKKCSENKKPLRSEVAFETDLRSLWPNAERGVC